MTHAPPAPPAEQRLRLDFSLIPTRAIAVTSALRVVDYTPKAALLFPTLARGLMLQDVLAQGEALQSVEHMCQEVAQSMKAHPEHKIHSANLHVTLGGDGEGGGAYTVFVENLDASASNREDTLYWISFEPEDQTHAELVRFIESVPDAVFLVDRERRIVATNALAERLFGYASDALLGQQIEALIPDRFRSRHPEYVTGFLGEGGNRLMGSDRRSQLFGLREDGTEFPVEIMLNTWNRGPSPTVMVSVRDISERLRAEAQFQSMLEMMPDALVVFDQHHRIMLVNQRAERLFEEERALLLGRSIHLLMDQDSRLDAQQAIAAIAGQQDVDIAHSTLSLIALTSSGRGFPVEMALAPMELQDQVMTLATFRDMTQQRAFEQQLENSRLGALEASRAKSQFLSNMSHELRTPLNGVLGYSQLLLQEPNISVRQRESLVSIQQCGEHLLALINDVLDLSKVDSGALVLDSKPLPLGAFLSNLSRVVRPRAEAKGLELRFEVAEEELPEGILCDSLKLRQVLINLLGNAIKFTQKGRVVLRCTEPEEGVIRFEVRDTGFGISKQEQRQIFEPFQQSASGLAIGGTGLGLAITKRIIEAMGGTLGVESEEGVGSVFTVDIPTQFVSARELSEVEENPSLGAISWELPKGQHLKVLVVDDIDTNRDVLCSLLQGAGIETLNASNGLEAIEIVTTQHPDFIFMDVRMPVLDGLSATGRLRAMEAFKDLPIVAITASVFPESRRKVQAAGCTDIVGKPFRTHELFDTLERYLPVEFTRRIAPVDDSHPSNPFLEAPASQLSLLELGEALQEALEVGDMFEIEAIARDKVPQPWKRGLIDAAGAFDFGKIESTLKQMLTTFDPSAS